MGLPEDVRERILLAVEETHQGNLQKVHALDQKFRSLYTSAAGLVNDAMETFRAFGKVTAALNIRQQFIVRKSGPFVRKATPPSRTGKQLKPGAKPVPAAAVSSAQAALKKKRSRGKGRKIQGLPPRPNPPPAPAPASDQWKTTSAPWEAPRYPAVDIREKQKRLQNTVSKSDLRNRLEERHHNTW